MVRRLVLRVLAEDAEHEPRRGEETVSIAGATVRSV